MRNTLTIAGKELKGYFVQPVAYVVLTVFLLLGGWFFFSMLRQFDEMVQHIVRARFGVARTVIQAAVDRGELPGGTPPDLIIDAIMGRVISLIVLTPGARRGSISAAREHYAASVTDFVLQAITHFSAQDR